MPFIIKDKNLNNEQRQVIKEAVAGLNFIASTLEQQNLPTLTRLIRAVMVDITCWSEHSHMFNDPDKKPTKSQIDTSIIAAFDFLSKYVNLECPYLREEILRKLEEHNRHDILSSSKLN